MSAQSADDENRPPDDEAAEKTSGDSQAEGVEDVNPTSPPSVFVNSEPMREEQVENAVKFLSHPKVRGSPVIYRRSFLEKKGLTKEEIDEAFRRVPDSPPSAETSTVTQEGQSRSLANVQQQAPMQALQPAVAAPSGVIASVRPASRDHFHWYHAKLAIGIWLAGSAVGTFIFVKKVVLPRLRSWIRSVVLGDVNGVSRDSYLRPSLAEETAAAAKAAASAAVDVARASEELLRSKLQEKRFFTEITNLLDVQLREIKSLSVAMKNLQGQANYSVTNTFPNGQLALPTTFPKQPPYANGKSDWDYREGRYSTPQASAEPSSAPHPKSYMEIMGMIQRGEKPPNIMDIDDSPPNPNQQISNPRLAPRMKPWEVGQTPRSLNQPFPYQLNPGRVESGGFVSQSLGNNPGPQWQPSNDLRIPELENQSGMKTWAHNASSFEQPTKRSWVPPQPPPVAMAEAAEAIRRPKRPVPREQLSDDKKVIGSSEAGGAAGDNGVSPELNATIPREQLSDDQRVFGSSEAGGATGDNGLNSELNSSVNQEEGSSS